MIASVGFSIVGSGTVSTRTSCVPCQARAFMAIRSPRCRPPNIPGAITGPVIGKREAMEQRPLALVTGASSGIGYELAKQFAANGFDLIVNAEDDAIHDVAAELNAEAVQVDLATPGGVDELYARVTAGGRPLAAAALNAGIGMGGAFATQTDLKQELGIVALNCRSTVHLAKHVLRDMVARDEGRVLFTSSIASTMPGSFQAVYNASKSFVQSFALALRNELKDTNVTITSLMPGPTETEFFERADM